MNIRNRPLWQVMFAALRRADSADILGLIAIVVMLLGALLVTAGMEPVILLNEAAR